MGKILNKLAEGRVLVSDGAWGTFLHEKGLKADECPESWNLTRPDDVLDIARRYVDAGADLILTNSFGGSPIKLDRFGLGDKAFEINRQAAVLSRKAAGERALVLGSVGPTGKIVFTGEVVVEDMKEGFAQQVRALQEGGADGILIETMSEPDEARAAIEAAKEHTRLDVACTFTFSRTGEGEYRTMMGTGIDEFIHMARESGADIIGANCGNGTEGMVGIVEQIREIDRSLPVLVHANAGSPRMQNGETVFPESPEEMARQIPELVRAGASIVGGCCGTTPEHIKLIAKAIHGDA